jgi:hypothetical protein
MKTIAYRTIDKAAWPRGPWDKEPDKVQWQDKASRLPCLAVRHQAWGHWCGYVGVPPGHPMFQKGGEGELAAHGGINFAAMCAPDATEATGVCHVAGPGEPDVWWLGFDCAHAWDLQPGMVDYYHRFGAGSRFFGGEETYRTLRYVRRECRELANQLAALASVQ